MRTNVSSSANVSILHLPKSGSHLSTVPNRCWAFMVIMFSLLKNTVFYVSIIG